MGKPNAFPPTTALTVLQQQQKVEQGKSLAFYRQSMLHLCREVYPKRNQRCPSTSNVRFSELGNSTLQLHRKVSVCLHIWQGRHHSCRLQVHHCAHRSCHGSKPEKASPCPNRKLSGRAICHYRFGDSMWPLNIANVSTTASIDADHFAHALASSCTQITVFMRKAGD